MKVETIVHFFDTPYFLIQKLEKLGPLAKQNKTKKQCGNFFFISWFVWHFLLTCSMTFPFLHLLPNDKFPFRNGHISRSIRNSFLFYWRKEKLTYIVERKVVSLKYVFLAKLWLDMRKHLISLAVKPGGYKLRVGNP